MRRLFTLLLVLLAAVVGAFYVFDLRVLVIPPIGAIPEGATLVVKGVPGLRIIDSADAFCFRQGTLNLLCRAGVLAAVGQRAEDTIVLRLPYMAWLYQLTGAPDTDL